MATTVLIAGATGDLGGRITRALLGLGAGVRAIVRPGADYDKVSALKALGVEVIAVDMSDAAGLKAACTGVSCIVSALQGLRDVIVNVQSNILKAALSAGVPRFIPSDYSSDFTKLAPGENRNFDLRREFHTILDTAPIAATSVFNGAFAELLSYNIPFLDFKKQRVGYWEDADIHVDFTTMDNTAAFTAAAALDPSAPRILRIAGIQVSALELATLASDIFHQQFQLTRFGTLEELRAYNIAERAAHPEGETEIYSSWQRSQYVQSMFSSHMSPLDNDRYPGIKWTGIQELLSAMAQRNK